MADTNSSNSSSCGGRDYSNHGQASTVAPTILVEVVSALNVPRFYKNKEPDPYVTASLGGVQIHETAVLYKTDFPIWSLELSAFFLVQAETDEDVVFCLKEYEMFRGNPTLGTVEISVQEMLQGKGDRQEFPLEVPAKMSMRDVTSASVRKSLYRRTRLVLRFKPASTEDVAFIRTQSKQKKCAGIYAKETWLPPQDSPQKSGPMSLGLMAPIDEWGGRIFGMEQKPKRDTTDYSLIEAMKPSEEWIKVGKPDAPGKVFVEVLACDGLPNLDTPSLLNINNLTDAFCCLILEDSIVNTSYISDNLSPRWMPTGDNRAFCFGVEHPSSHLYLGVFNHNSAHKLYKPMNAFREWIHTPIGRVLINLTNFYPDTVYTLHYNLYEVSSDAAKDRREGNHNGTITIRLRIEWEYQILSGMGLPRENFVSVPRRHDFQTATYTLVGERGSGDFSMKNLTSFLEELQSYISDENINLVIQAALSVLLWRCTWPIKVFGRQFHLPFHSMVAFTWGILVTNDYNRIPSFAVFCVAWFFLACMEHNRQHPSPWHQCEAYDDLFWELLAEVRSHCMGKTRDGFFARRRETIAANENIDQIKPHLEALEQRKKCEEEVKQRKALELEEEVKRHEAEMAVLSEASIATAKRETVKFFESLNPVKPILHPVQNILHSLCIYLRIFSSIVSWADNYFPFWIVTACFVVSFVIFFIPWGWIMRWLIRVLVWVLLGPWMSIADRYYFAQVENMTPDQQEQYIEEQALEIQKNFQEQRLESRTHKEAAVKLKSMMKYFFGKYVVNVPRFQQAQFLDKPLPASTAEPYKDGEEIHTIGQVVGQTLDGDMIPTRVRQTQTFLREINHEAPSQRISMRPQTPHALAKNKLAKGSEGPRLGNLGKRKQKRKLSFRSMFKKYH